MTTERKTVNLWPEAGKILGLSRASTYTAARSGEIPTIKIGSRYLVPIAALERLLASAEKGAEVAEKRAEV
jgi:excisionase family DNA binding protein